MVDRRIGWVYIRFMMLFQVETVNSRHYNVKADTSNPEPRRVIADLMRLSLVETTDGTFLNTAQIVSWDVV